VTPDEPLETLLDKLASGDLDAAAQVFMAYEAYLRKVVRRHLPAGLRAKFDSVDVVQSVWVDVLRRLRQPGPRFADTEHLRAFLILVTRHRLSDRLRHFHLALEREERLPSGSAEKLPPGKEPRPSQTVQADDLWERMLSLCPPEHHELLWLKREGLPLKELAARSGLHPDSIRRIFRHLARQLAVEQAP
jgi:RNA polymerase sigma-70 factor (ECF subfamily)